MLLVSLAILLVAAGTMHLVRADIVSAGASESMLQSRMNMRSAVRAYGLELIKEREEMFRGSAPQVPEEIELFEIGERVAVARLLPLGPSGERVVSEAGKIDINRATSDSLVSTGIMDVTTAERIVSERESRVNGQFRSVHDLLDFREAQPINEVVMYGPLEDIQILSLVDSDLESRGERVAALMSQELGGEIRGALDIFTAHSFEPNVRKDGQPRAALSSPIQGNAIPFEYPAAEACVERVTGAGLLFEEPPRMADVLRVVIEDFPDESESFSAADARGEAFDSLTNTSQDWRNGLVDINSAPFEVLVAIPGMTTQIAEAILETRDSVKDEYGFDRLWPVRAGIVTTETWATIVDGITTRSFLWRVRIVAGIIAPDADNESIESPLVWEVLFDCSASPARVVEVRDVTMLELIARMLDVEGDQALAVPDIRVNDEDSNVSGGIEFEDPLFQNDPLFNEEPMFNDGPLFDDEPLFGEDPLFGDQPLFGAPRSMPSPSNSSESENSNSGPSGRWSPAASQR